MHPYCWNTAKLKEQLPPFIGGQCRVERKGVETYRGKVKAIKVLDTKKNTVIVEFEWLCSHGEFCDRDGIAEHRWVLMPTPLSGSYCLELSYSIYYFQEDEFRLKMITKGEMSRFYGKDDHTNLVPDPKHEGRYVPYHQVHKKTLRNATIIALLMRTVPKTKK